MKVEIQMTTRQTVDDESETLCHTARGILHWQDRVAVITYLLDGVHHELRIDTEKYAVTVIRNWQESGALRYQRGRKHTVLYETPVGSMELRFDTKQLLMDVPDQPEDRLLVDMSYAVYQFDSLMMECELRIEIFPLK